MDSKSNVWCLWKREARKIWTQKNTREKDHVKTEPEVRVTPPSQTRDWVGPLEEVIDGLSPGSLRENVALLTP